MRIIVLCVRVRIGVLVDIGLLKEGKEEGGKKRKRSTQKKERKVELQHQCTNHSTASQRKPRCYVHVVCSGTATGRATFNGNVVWIPSKRPSILPRPPQGFTLILQTIIAGGVVSNVPVPQSIATKKAVHAQPVLYRNKDNVALEFDICRTNRRTSKLVRTTLL